MVRQVAVPGEARALSTLPQIDYADAFVVEARPVRAKPEHWLLVMLEGAPLSTRTALRWAWFALGLRLGLDGSTRFVLGWKVLAIEPGHRRGGPRILEQGGRNARRARGGSAG